MGKPSVSINGSKIFVTGASGGIGQTIAVEMARHGGQMILAGNRNLKGLNETVDMIRQQGGTVLESCPVNIMNEEEVKAFAADIQGRFGTVDIIVNNAGVLVSGEMQHLTHKDWELVLGVNLWGTINVISAFLPAMIEQQRGHIFNVGSFAGLVGHPWQGTYSASKFAVVGLSEVLRYDLRQYNIGVSVICPGPVKTNMMQSVKIVHPDQEKAAKRKAVFSKAGTTPEKIVERMIKSLESNKFMAVTPDMAWIWYLKRYTPLLFEGYQRLFFGFWHRLMR